MLTPGRKSRETGCLRHSSFKLFGKLTPRKASAARTTSQREKVCEETVGGIEEGGGTLYHTELKTHSVTGRARGANRKKGCIDKKGGRRQGK